jgi:hypothetical protein
MRDGSSRVALVASTTDARGRCSRRVGCIDTQRDQELFAPALAKVRRRGGRKLRCRTAARRCALWIRSSMRHPSANPRIAARRAGEFTLRRDRGRRSIDRSRTSRYSPCECWSSRPACARDCAESLATAAFLATSSSCSSSSRNRTEPSTSARSQIDSVSTRARRADSRLVPRRRVLIDKLASCLDARRVTCRLSIRGRAATESSLAALRPHAIAVLDDLGDDQAAAAARLLQAARRYRPRRAVSGWRAGVRAGMPAGE